MQQCVVLGYQMDCVTACQCYTSSNSCFLTKLDGSLQLSTHCRHGCCRLANVI